MRCKIRYFTIICVFVFLIFFRPASYILGNKISTYLNYYIVALFIATVIFSVYLRRFGYRMTKTSMLILLLYFWELVGSSIINTLLGKSIAYSNAINFFCEAALFILVCDIGMAYSPKKTIRAFLFVGITICALNALSFFLYYKRGGMYTGVQDYNYGRRIERNTYFLLGRDNATFFWSWPVLVCSWYYYLKYKKNRLFFSVVIIYTVLVTYSYFYVWSVMAAFACASVPFAIIFLYRSIQRQNRDKSNNGKGKPLNFGYLWVAGLLFNVLLSLGLMIQYMLPLIVDVFHRTNTLSSRTIIWERGYFEIFRSPIWGYGTELTETTVAKLTINHTHNFFLETMYRGGIIGLVILIMMFVTLTKETQRCCKLNIYKYLIWMVFFLLIFMSVEFAYYRYHYLILLILLSRSDIKDDFSFAVRRSAA